MSSSVTTCLSSVSYSCILWQANCALGYWNSRLWLQFQSKVKVQKTDVASLGACNYCFAAPVHCSLFSQLLVLECLSVPLRIALVPTCPEQYLLAGCEEGCFTWNIKLEKEDKTRWEKQLLSVTTEVVLALFDTEVCARNAAWLTKLKGSKIAVPGASRLLVHYKAQVSEKLISSGN